MQQLTRGRTVLGRCSSTGCFTLTVLLLASCQSSPPSAEAPTERTAPEKAPVASFDCDTLALTATFHDDRVVFELPGRSLTLPHVVSAWGARYSNGPVTFRNKGREATFDMDGRKQTCRERREPWQDKSAFRLSRSS